MLHKSQSCIRTFQLKRAEEDLYFPHPAPNAKIDDSKEAGADSKMGASLSLLKTLLIPALISLILYLLVSYLVVPAWKRYRARYSQYIPLDTISSRSTTFRQRLQATIAKYLLPSSWRSDFNNNGYIASAQDSLGSAFDDNDGEELFDVDDNRREALSLDARRGAMDDRRLSRDLEEGFKDDSDDEGAGAGNRNIQSASR